MTVKELVVMAENGVSLEAIHEIHSDTQHCPLCDKWNEAKK